MYLKQIVTVTLTALLATFAQSAAHAQQKLMPAQSQISFVTKQMGVPVEGKFAKFDAQLAFDPKKLDASKISFTVDLNSVEIGDSNTIAEVKKVGWFNTLKFPAASFTSAAIKSTGAGKYEFAGAISIKGKAQNITVPVTLTQQAGNTTAVGSFTLKRLDFGIGEGEWNDVSLVANEVVVRLKLVLTGVASL